jgi:purine-cytosine permease-like protein
MGWWPSRLCVILNWVIEMGYGLVDCLVAGLLLSAVNGEGMSVIVGIVISALITVSSMENRDLDFNSHID